MHVEQSIIKLNSLLPLYARQQVLGEGYISLHRSILQRMLRESLALDVYAIADMSAVAGLDEDAEAIIHRLAESDLVVTDEDRARVIGAYPLTTEPTGYQLKVDGTQVNAMCALAAVSVAPMFDVVSLIRSACHLTGHPIEIGMDNSHISYTNLPDIHVGVCWQLPSGAAAHSLCVDIVFLKDSGMADAWLAGHSECASVYRLPDAIALGAGFFGPLMEEQVILTDEELMTA